MNLGTFAGKILLSLAIIFLCMFVYALNSYAELENPYLYGGAAFFSFVFGVICYNIGMLVEKIEKTERTSTSILKVSQDILSEIKNNRSDQKIKEPHDTSPEKKCSKCGNVLSNDASKCPHCGESAKWGW